MLRLQIISLIRLLQTRSTTEVARSAVSEFNLGHVTSIRRLHTSKHLFKGDQGSRVTEEIKENKSDATPIDTKEATSVDTKLSGGTVLTKEIPADIKLDDTAFDVSKAIPIDKELHDAAIDAAKSLPGDWKETSNLLLSRLTAHQSPKADSEITEDHSTVIEEPKSQSLLETMRVSKSVPEKRPADRRRDQCFGRRRPFQMRRQEYTSLFDVPRIGIFDPETVKKSVGQKQPALGQGLWEEKDRELLRLLTGSIPRNAWEEQIDWTRQGKLWNFPIDNEAYLHKERQYKFHEHVFLERHLGNDFPETGPIRKFMSLVCLGLSKQYLLTVPEKVAHIRFFVGYFKEKQEVLSATIPGPEGLMPSGGDKIDQL